MASRKILTIGKHEKLLRTKSEPVKKVNREVRALIEDIRDTIQDPQVPAIGLAAVQIGVLKRVFGARLAYQDDQKDEEMHPPTIFVNPEILERSEEETRGHDACLSIPGMTGYTNRHTRIKVSYLDEHGKRVVREFTDWDARVIEHEIDHLDGILFLDRLKSLEDLFVYVRDAEGKHKQVPYLEVVKQASESTETRKPSFRLPEQA